MRILKGKSPLYLCFLLLLSSCDSFHAQQEEPTNNLITPKVIYGDDNRKDLYEVTNPSHLILAQSTVALISDYKISDNGTGFSDIDGGVYGENYGLCKSEPYFKQPNAAFCSGFLLASNIIVTAGHCITSQRDCNNTKFIFDYGVLSIGSYPERISNNQIYGCSKLIHTEVASSGSDFAVVELDRDVTDRQPLSYRTQGTIIEDDPLVVIGHPAGLPTKVADGASVRSLSETYFSADLDTYGGNSGSAVFNELSGNVEGVLVRGETDFVYKNGCRESNVCSNGSCRGEDVTKITQVIQYLPTPPTPVISISERYKVSQEVNRKIPDNSLAGVNIAISAKEAPLNRKIQLSVNISHSWRGDLTLHLISPKGDRYLLQSRSGGSRDDIIGTYILKKESWTLNSSTPLNKQIGLWNLVISDQARFDIGYINKISLEFVK